MSANAAAHAHGFLNAEARKLQSAVAFCAWPEGRP